MRRLLEDDTLTGTRQTFIAEPDGESYTIVTRQALDDTMDVNKEQHKLTKRKDRWRDMNHVARIPMTILASLWKSGIAWDKKALRKWLNDPDNRVFRTRAGII